jgi:hypothetical protein
LKSGAASFEKRGIWHKEDVWELHQRKKKEEGEHARKGMAMNAWCQNLLGKFSTSNTVMGSQIVQISNYSNSFVQIYAVYGVSHVFSIE